MGTIKTTNIETITGSGTLTLGQSGETISIPSGVTISGAAANTPRFNSYLSATQTSGISSGTWNKLLLNTVDYDTGGYFDTSNNRYTPLIAGSYQFNAEVNVSASGLSYTIISLYKNGSMYQRGTGLNATQSENYCTVSTVIPMNGSTDYVEVYVYATYSSSPNFYGGSIQTSYLNGYKLIG